MQLTQRLMCFLQELADLQLLGAGILALSAADAGIRLDRQGCVSIFIKFFLCQLLVQQSATGRSAEIKNYVWF